jgi:hypothetical protein
MCLGCTVCTRTYVCMYVCGLYVHLCVRLYVCVWGRMYEYICGDVCMNVGMCICVGEIKSAKV